MTDELVTIDDRSMPSDVAAAFENALGLHTQPSTLGEWIDATARRMNRAGITFGVDEMCLTERSPHRARIDGDDRHFACVLDTLLVPFVMDVDRDVRIRTRSPTSGAAIRIEATRDAVHVEPSTAVMSFGIAGDTSPPDERDGVLASGTVQFCPYINAFVDETEYAAWATDTPEAVTMGLSLEMGFALARSLVDALETA